MCGISVVLSAKQLPYDSIERMVSSLSHRGPDATADRLPGCHIGQSRLSIIDLVTGSQPMCDASGRFWIAFNGEIYNYRELRTLLQRGWVQDICSKLHLIRRLFLRRMLCGVKSVLTDSEICMRSHYGIRNKCVSLLREIYLVKSLSIMRLRLMGRFW